MPPGLKEFEMTETATAEQELEQLADEALAAYRDIQDGSEDPEIYGFLYCTAELEDVSVIKEVRERIEFARTAHDLGTIAVAQAPSQCLSTEQLRDILKLALPTAASVTLDGAILETLSSRNTERSRNGCLHHRSHDPEGGCQIED